jgi:hypothetical protein
MSLISAGSISLDSTFKYQINVFHLVLILSETSVAKSKVPDSGDKVDSGIGLPKPMVNVLESTLEWT